MPVSRPWLAGLSNSAGGRSLLTGVHERQLLRGLERRAPERERTSALMGPGMKAPERERTSALRGPGRRAPERERTSAPLDVGVQERLLPAGLGGNAAQERLLPAGLSGMAPKVTADPEITGTEKTRGMPTAGKNAAGKAGSFFVRMAGGCVLPSRHGVKTVGCIAQPSPAGFSP